METNSRENIFAQWALWQFFEMPAFILRAWNNYLTFALNFFSLPLLLKTFFSPWRKYKWNYPRGFDLKIFFETVISNVFSRIMGALMRVTLIFVGILFQIFVVTAGAVVFLAWLAVPFLAAAGLIFIFFL